jgi:Cyclin, N-terminal domain
VLRAHILQSDMEDTPVRDEHRIFNDLESQQKPLNKKRNAFRPQGVDYFVAKPPAPTLDQITTFYRDVFRRAQMEPDCIIMSLIYVERLIKQTNGSLRPRTSNWRSVLFSCMVLASKVWDDLSMWNADFSQTCPAGVEFSLARINELEIAVLNALEYKTKVVASEYAKYYFLLRSMLIKSGLGGDDLKTMNPLDIEGAKRLQQVSTRFQSTASRRRLNVNGGGDNGSGAVPRGVMGRSKSEAIVAANGNGGGGGKGTSTKKNSKNSTASSTTLSKSRPTISTLPGASSKECFMTKGKVGLEHMVHL